MTRTQNITFLGPLSVEMNIYVENGIKLANETNYFRYEALTYGGPLLRQVQIMRSLGYNPEVIGYVGRDAEGEKIIEKMQEEQVRLNVQKIPGYTTNLLMNFSDKKCYSYLTSYPPNLDIWRYRFQNINKKGIIVLDPNIPSYIQKEIIDDFPLATIIVRRPLDGKLNIFNTDKKLLVLLNELDAFTIFSSLNRNFYSPYEVLYCSLLCNHNVVIEDNEQLYTLDEEDRTLQILDFSHKQRSITVLNNHFVAGATAAAASQQNHLGCFLWGLICSIKNHQLQKINKNEIIAATKQYKWKTFHVDRFGNIKK